MAFITNKDQILDCVSLDEVIRLKLPHLKRAGANLTGKCPWHDEASGSFSFSPVKKVFKCFGCGKSGAYPAQFLRHYDNVSFLDALHQLSKIGGVKIEYDASVDIEEYNKVSAEKLGLKKTIRETMRVAHSFLLSQSKTLEDYAGKSWDEDTIDTFQIIVVGKDSPLSNSDLDKDNLKLAGLIKSKEGKDNYRDHYFNRILYPVFDCTTLKIDQKEVVAQDVVTYNGRALHWKKGDKFGKYINSANSEISKHLFGYAQAYPFIKRENKAYLVEGPTDMMALWQLGVRNVVARLGSSFTAEQANLLAYICDHVVIIPDNDPAGEKSILSTAEMLISANQLQVSVLPLRTVTIDPDIEGDEIQTYVAPKGCDVYDFVNQNLNSNYLNRWFDYHEKLTSDVVDYIVKRTLGDNPNEFTKVAAIQAAASLIQRITSDTTRELYIKSTSSNIPGGNINIVRSALKEVAKEDDGIKLDADQKKDKGEYGLYVKNNKLYNFSNKEIADFHVESLYLIHHEDKAHRLIRMTNFQGKKKMLILPQQSFTNIGEFKVFSESNGEFLFYGTADEYTKVRKRAYRNVPDAYMVDVLGFHRASGCFIFSNGVVKPDGSFKPTNDYGVVDFTTSDEKEFHFYLPIFSNVIDERTRNDDDDLFERAFVYPYQIKAPNGCPTDLSTFGNLWNKCWGHSGVTAYCFYLATVFRDIVKVPYNSFPLMNLFGKTNSGKSQMGDMLTCMFHKFIPPTHCETSTDAAYYRTPMKAENVIIQLEEYAEDLPKRRREFLKDAWDGRAREIADKQSTSKTKQAQIKSAILYTGETPPGGAASLVNRSTTENLKIKEVAEEVLTLSNNLRKWGRQGHLVPITAQLHSYRKVFEDGFLESLDYARKELKMRTIDIDVTDRILHNHALLLASYIAVSRIVVDERAIEMPYKLTSVIELMVSRIEDQVILTKGAEELTDWWDTILFLINKGELTENFYNVEPGSTMKVVAKGNQQKEVEVPIDHPVLYISLPFAYQMYTLTGQSKEKKSKAFIQSYLEESPAFVGIRKAKRCGEKVHRCHAFDLTKMPGFEFKYTGSNAHLNLEKKAHDVADTAPNPEDDLRPKVEQQSIAFNKPNGSGDDVPF